MKLTEETKYQLELSESFSKAFDLIENTNKNVFVTGQAGTGKSTLLQFFRDNTRKNIVVLAPTGVAAVNVQGQTIHSFFCFRPDITPDGVYNITLRKSQSLIYEKIDAVVIDEISMVRADLLDCIDTFLRIYGKKQNAPFGGVQMIFFGDLYQLPPVVTADVREIFRTVYPSPYFFDASAFKTVQWSIVELDKIYRQKEEGFIHLLGSIRNNSANQLSLKELNDRLNPAFNPNDNDFYIYLSTTNALADQINSERLKALEGDEFISDGKITGSFDQKGLPTQPTLTLKRGAQVMLLNNDPQGRWVNGSIGKITFLDETQSLGTEIIEIELEDGQIVQVSPITWEMYRFIYNEDVQALESETTGTFRQYPLRLAWAITIHKSQGKTFSKVVIDIGSGTFSHGQLYVALSRCESLEGIILRKPIMRKHIMLDSRIVMFMQRFKEESEAK